MIKHFRIAGRLAMKLEELGVSVSAVLRRAGLPKDLFQKTRVLVSTEELFAFWRAIEDVSKDPDLALKLATESRTERFHPSGIAALSTDSFGTAVQYMARYKQLTCPEEIVSSIEGGEWVIRFRWLLAMNAEPTFLVEYCFAWIYTIAQHGSGRPVSPLRVELVQQRAHTKNLEEYFGCKVVRGAAQNALIFKESDAAIPFITHNADLLDMLAPQFDAEMKQQLVEHSFVEQVRDAIQQRLTGTRPAMHDIAKNLHMSARTLQRRLQEAGSSYQRVLEEARHQMARYYLGNSVLELNEAAYLLGYEDASSFVRAFRNWEGVPPGQWREIHGAKLLQS